ncbi:hypothetical protein NKH77_23405 [Streptomyces sp. M19]
MSTDPRLVEAVRRISAQHRVDYLDDDVVAEMLREHERQVRRAGLGPGLIGVLALLVGSSGPYCAGGGRPTASRRLVTRQAGRRGLRGADRPRSRVHHHGRRPQQAATAAPALEGYRKVLGVAIAHGYPHSPYRPGSSGAPGRRARVGADPRYAPVPPLNEERTAVAETARPPQVRRARLRPPSLTRSSSTSAWPTSADGTTRPAPSSCSPASSPAPGPTGLRTSRRWPSSRPRPVRPWPSPSGWRGPARAQKEALRKHARAYLRELVAAQAAGTVVPELSPPLRKLLDEPGFSAPGAGTEALPETEQGASRCPCVTPAGYRP